MMQTNRKGFNVATMVLCLAAVVIIFFVVNSIVSKGTTGAVDGTKNDYLSLAAAFCEVRCPLICYGRECEDSDECVYENPGLENPIRMSCTNLHPDDDGGPVSSSKPSINGIFKPCGKMTLTYTGATEDFGAVKLRLCEDITKPGTCRKLYKTLSPAVELPSETITVDGINHIYYKLCDPTKCTADSKGKVTTDFYLPCDDTLNEKKTYTLKVEPYSTYGEQKLSLKWTCPTVSYPKGIHPGRTMPVKFSDFIAETPGNMNADLTIKNGCYVGNTPIYIGSCKATNSLVFKTGTNYEYDVAMPWVNPASPDNSIIFEIKPSATGPVVCKAGGFFTWSCPANQCWNHDTKDYILTGLDASGTKVPNPSCKYTTETECTVPCVAAPTDFLKGDCKDTETKFEIRDIYMLSEYPYKCSGGKDDLPYRHDKNGKQICKFDAAGKLDEAGSIDNYKKIYKTCDADNKLNKGNIDCKCDATGKLDASGNNANCRYPACSPEPYEYSPAGTDVCMCDDKGNLNKEGTKVCQRFINDGSDAFRIDTASSFEIEIKNTGAVDAKIEASKLAVTFDGAAITPGMFVKVLNADRTPDTSYANEQDYILKKGSIMVYEFTVTISGVATKMYPVRAVLSYLDRSTEKAQNVMIYGKCCNGCSCPGGSECNACTGYCTTRFTGECYFA